jgi:catechol 2,3-dioxygenase-like lactoylglutathione lyase family enzyme
MPINTLFRFDHAVIMVDDLQAAAADYQALGFTVLPGGAHEGNPSHNALISLADGSYLELFALREAALRRKLTTAKRFGLLKVVIARRDSIVQRFLHNVVLGEGLADFALLSESLQDDIEAARKRGVPIEGPQAGGCKRPDGKQLTWEFGVTPMPLPFLLMDTTPRLLRVPEGDVQNHPNGAADVIRIDVAVKNLAKSTADFSALLGFEPEPCGDQEPGVNAVNFALGPTMIRLATPTEQSSELHVHLKTRGEGPYALTLKTHDLAKTPPPDLQLSHAVQIRWVGDD